MADQPKTKVLKFEKRVDVDRGTGSIPITREIVPAAPRDGIYRKPAKNVLPSDEERLVGVDAADYYLYIKQEENATTEEDIRRGIFAAAFYMGMCAMATIFWALGYMKIG